MYHPPKLTSRLSSIIHTRLEERFLEIQKNLRLLPSFSRKRRLQVFNAKTYPRLCEGKEKRKNCYIAILFHVYIISISSGFHAVK